MEDETMRHLWHHGGTHYVRSECELEYPKVKRRNLVFGIREAECQDCLKARRIYTSVQTVACTARLSELIEASL